MQNNKKSKITVVGAGAVGSQTICYAAMKNLGDLVLIDVASGLAEGRALDILESMPVVNSDVKIIGGSDYSLIKDSDIVVVTAGVARKPGMTRDDLININAGIVKAVMKEVVEHAPQSIVVMVTNPLDNMVKLAYEISGFSKNRVMGMAGVLDSARLRTFLAMETNVSVSDIEAMVLGGHGDTMVPVLSACMIKGKPVSEIVPKEKLEAIIARTRNGGGEIINLLKTGSTCFAPAMSIVEMIENILGDTKKILPCSVLLEGEYGEKDVFAGVPVVLGINGIEKVVEMPLSVEEKDAFKHSIDHIRSMTEKA